MLRIPIARVIGETKSEYFILKLNTGRTQNFKNKCVNLTKSQMKALGNSFNSISDI